MPRFWFAAALVGLSLAPAQAHNVIVAVWTVGTVVEGEIGFSNGELAPAGTLVRVLGPEGDMLGETRVDSDGLFRFEPKLAVPHRFVADLGLGHVAQIVLGVDELPTRLAREATPASIVSTETTELATTGLDGAALEQLVAMAVQREMAPLKRALAQRERDVSLQGILGGIGYIAGLFGLYFFIQARRQRR